jgi:simple sugar transport system substrate-binding protein
MAHDDVLGDGIERLEWAQERSGEPSSERTRMTRRTALAGGASGLAAALLAACGSSAEASTTTTTTTSAAATAAAAVFGSANPLKFAVVNHAKLSGVYLPTQNGAADACKLLGCSFAWTGSASANVAEMVMAIDTAVAAKVDGIATTLIDATAFNVPVAAALDAHIPVISYSSDVHNNLRLAYVGSNPRLGGREMAERIKTLLPSGGTIAVFNGVPGVTALDSRMAGLTEGLSGSGITVEQVASGPGQSQESRIIDAFITAHPNYHGFFAVDGASTAVVAQALQSGGLAAKGVVGGGYDLTATTQELLASGDIEFAIDEQQYLQGFLPILELYLYRMSNGFSGPADVDTGVRFVDKHAANGYESNKSRFEGSSSSPGVQTS